jgi:hypothetical protein
VNTTAKETDSITERARTLKNEKANIIVFAVWIVVSIVLFTKMPTIGFLGLVVIGFAGLARHCISYWIKSRS